jgi:hypothetical protein
MLVGASSLLFLDTDGDDGEEETLRIQQQQSSSGVHVVDEANDNVSCGGCDGFSRRTAT